MRHLAPLIKNLILSNDYRATPPRPRGIQPDKRGGLNGSMQHLVEVFVVTVCEADLVRERQFKQNKALFRFRLNTAVRIDS
jgi:hypothetical protein